MHILLDDSLIRLNSNVLETNILNLLVVLGSLGVLVRQYSDSVVDSYDVVLYDIIADSYSLEKELQVVQTEYITALSKVIRVYLNAALTHRRLMLTVKAKIFARTRWLRHRFTQVEKKSLQTCSQEFYERWEKTVFDVATKELIEEFSSSEEKQREFIDLKIQYLEEELENGNIKLPKATPDKPNPPKVTTGSSIYDNK